VSEAERLERNARIVLSRGLDEREVDCPTISIDGETLVCDGEWIGAYKERTGGQTP